MAEELIPVFLFLVIFGSYAFNRYFRFKTQQEIQTTLRLALEQGRDLSPEILASLVPQPDPQADRRRAVISLMLAAAVAAFATVLGEPDAIGPLLGIACFPLFLSLAYFWLSRSSRADSSDSAPVSSL